MWHNYHCLYGIIVMSFKKEEKKQRKQVICYISLLSLIRLISNVSQDIKIGRTKKQFKKNIFYNKIQYIMFLNVVLVLNEKREHCYNLLSFCIEMFTVKLELKSGPLSHF